MSTYSGLPPSLRQMKLCELQEGNPKDWADCCGSLGAFPALAEIPVNVICRPEWECSSTKSSAKVSLFLLAPSGSIPEELVLSAWPAGLNEL
jgi:hypothetical protein